MMRLSQRDHLLDVAAVEKTLSTSLPTPYFHDGIWKLGFWNAEARVFVGTVEGRITTVMRSSEGYIRKLFKSSKPD
jgi:hypothetical protein